MARQEIILGTAPTGLGGDPPRTASTKINDMTTEIYSLLAGSDGAIPGILPISKGGTGGSTQGAARNGLGLGSASVAEIVGTVSQSGGTPTGAIVETGTNANGTYTKWADGTMICSYTGKSQVAINTAYSSSLFQSSAARFTFPVAFVGAIPRVTPTASNSQYAVAWALQQGDITLAASGVVAISGYNYATTLLGYIAIGRWY